MVVIILSTEISVFTLEKGAKTSDMDALTTMVPWHKREYRNSVSQMNARGVGKGLSGELVIPLPYQSDRVLLRLVEHKFRPEGWAPTAAAASGTTMGELA